MITRMVKRSFDRESGTHIPTLRDVLGCDNQCRMNDLCRRRMPLSPCRRTRLTITHPMFRNHDDFTIQMGLRGIIHFLRTTTREFKIAGTCI
jgi:hypothetical protein